MRRAFKIFVNLIHYRIQIISLIAIYLKISSIIKISFIKNFIQFSLQKLDHCKLKLLIHFVVQFLLSFKNLSQIYSFFSIS